MKTARARPSSANDLVVRALLARGERSAALEAVLAAYGAEVFGMIVGVVDKRRIGEQVYADVLARAVQSIGELDSSQPVRLWLYNIAHRALSAHRKRNVGDATTRTEELRPVVAAVRRGLNQEDRELLILHVDRALDWSQLARVELGGDASTAAIDSEAAALATRFERLIDRMRDLTVRARKGRG